MKDDRLEELQEQLKNLDESNPNFDDLKEMLEDDIRRLTEGGMAELGQLCRNWGVEESKIEELGLNVLGSVGGYTAGNG